VPAGRQVSALNETAPDIRGSGAARVYKGYAKLSLGSPIMVKDRLILAGNGDPHPPPSFVAQGGY
jgi:hypothetical protein